MVVDASTVWIVEGKELNRRGVLANWVERAWNLNIQINLFSKSKELMCARWFCMRSDSNIQSILHFFSLVMDSLSPFIQNRRISMQDRSSPPYLRYDFPLSCCIYSKINIILFSRNSVVESLNVCVVWIRISIEIWIIFEFNLNRHVKFFFFFDRFKNTSRMHRLSLVLCFSSRIYLQIRGEKF